MALQVKNIDPKSGHFELHDDDGLQRGVGRAKASHISGFVTLTLYNAGGTMVLRVPINWVKYLELEGSDSGNKD